MESTNFSIPSENVSILSTSIRSSPDIILSTSSPNPRIATPKSNILGAASASLTILSIGDSLPNNLPIPSIIPDTKLPADIATKAAPTAARAAGSANIVVVSTSSNNLNASTISVKAGAANWAAYANGISAIPIRPTANAPAIIRGAARPATAPIAASPASATNPFPIVSQSRFWNNSNPLPAAYNAPPSIATPSAPSIIDPDALPIKNPTAARPTSATPAFARDSHSTSLNLTAARANGIRDAPISAIARAPFAIAFRLFPRYLNPLPMDLITPPTPPSEPSLSFIVGSLPPPSPLIA